MPIPFANPNWQVTDTAGNPVSGALIHTYAAGTSTRKATFTTAARSVAHTNPVVCDPAGKAILFLGAGGYRIEVTDADGAVLPAYSVDNVAQSLLDEDLADSSSASKGDALIAVKRTETGGAAQTLHIWIQRSRVCVGDFTGFTGDGVADDQAAWQAAANAAEGKWLVGVPDTVSMMEDELLLPANCWLDLYSQEMKFNVTGSKYGIKLRNRCAVSNGIVRHINTTSESGVNNSFRSAITIGSFNAGPAVGNTDTWLHDLTLSCSRPSGNVVSYYADSARCRMERLVIDGESVCKNGIAAHYGFLTGTPSEGVLHPYDLNVSSSYFANLDVGVYLSGAYNVTVDNTNEFVNCPRGIEIYRGDQGRAYAPAAVQFFVGKGFDVSGKFRECEQAFRIDGTQGLVTEDPYLEVTVRGAVVKGAAAGTSADAGIYARSVTRLTILDTEIADTDGDGVELAEKCSGVVMQGGSIHGCAQHGFRARDSADNKDITLRDVDIWGNAGANASSIKPGVYIGAAVEDATIDNVKFGRASGETQTHSVQISPLAVRPTVIHTHTKGAVSGIAIQVTGATSFATTTSMRMHLEDNTAASGLTVYDGSMPSTIGPTGALTALWNAVPTKGVWARGDRVAQSLPASGQPKGWSCTAAGGAYDSTRGNTTAYSLLHWALWSTGTTVWECTTAGTSAGSAPSIVGKVVGDTVTDGSVVWTMRSLTAATFETEGNL